ncbi:PglZ domain-containing protein [Ekhidna sp.]|uniref:T9SS response regulator signal transducer PorX n=1 Tax=Ekhidna sp. TaxID=2608089 RepID=UPI003B501960
MQQFKILWADDEIELLKPHILFLEQKGYELTPVNSGADALEQIDHNYFDIVFLDENMPGMSGLETLNYIKSTHPNTPVVMITRNEAEEIMEEAIGAKIADYLIKPLNPNQILLSVKKILDNKRIISEKTNLGYQKEFQQLAMSVMDADDHYDWMEIYKKLVYWELEIDDTEDKSMVEVLSAQKVEADGNFSEFITNNYESWITDPDIDRPLLSHNLLKQKVFPEIGEVPVFLIVIDNLRYDQWKIIEPDIAEMFSVESEEMYYSILPTTTSYARNALFGGMTPLEISRRFPDLWVDEEVDDGKNLREAELLEANMARNRIQEKFSYHKILRAEEGKQLSESITNLMSNALNAIVFNFVDMLSHARTDMQMIRELAPDESAYRSLTKSWFTHSSLYDTLKMLANHKVKVFITTDHGTIRVNKAQKIVGDRKTNTNLRYKVGKNLAFDEDSVFFTREPEKLGLPKMHVSSSYAFAMGDHFFAYPNNYNHYARHYKDTFQHGGISMEEIMIPFITLSNK